MKGTLTHIGMFAVAFAAIGSTAACTDTQRAHWGAYGSAGRITCYSGGHVILDDYSTGKISNAEGSDGYDFASATTHRLEQANGDCVIDYNGTPPAGWHAIMPPAEFQTPDSTPPVPVQ